MPQVAFPWSPLMQMRTLRSSKCKDPDSRTTAADVGLEPLVSHFLVAISLGPRDTVAPAAPTWGHYNLPSTAFPFLVPVCGLGLGLRSEVCRGQVEGVRKR